MLTDLNTVLAIAERRQCAIPAFNVYNAETAQGVLFAAEEADACVILQMYSRLFSNYEAEFLAPAILPPIAFVAVLDVASVMIFSWLMSSPVHSPVMTPSRMTTTRSQMPMTSGSSLEMTTTATPSAASSLMMW